MSTTSPSPLRTTALGTVVVLLVVMAFAALLSLRNVVVSIFLGLLLATALRPLMSRMREGGVPRLIAASVSVLSLVVAVTIFITLIVPLLVAQIQGVVNTLPGLYDGLRVQMVASQVLILRIIGGRMAEALPLGTMISSATLAEQTLALLPAAGYSLFVAVGTLLFSYYWLLYRDRSLRGLLLLIPLERRQQAEAIWMQIEDRIGAFVRGQALLALITGVCSLVAYLIIGLPYAPLIALIAGVLEFVPFLGPFLTTAVAVIIGLSISPGLGLNALVAGIIIQQIENIFLAPRIMDRAVGISPVVTLLAFVGFAALFGPVGGLLAIPLAAMLQVLFRAWVESTRAPAEVAEGGRGPADRVRYEMRALAQDITALLRAKEMAASADADASEDAIEQVLADLEILLAKASSADAPPDAELSAWGRPMGSQQP